MKEQQFPDRDQVFLDHVGIFVREFVKSGSTMERLGFVVTDLHAHRSALAPGQPLAPLGTGIRCIMLRKGFLELLGPTGEQTAMAVALHAALARYDGLHLIAFSATEPESFHSDVSARGLNPVPIARIRRNHAMQDGSLAEVGGAIVRLAPESWPEGRVQVVFPEMAPEVMWQPHLLDHPNGAIALSEMLIAVEDPAARAAQFARFTGKDNPPSRRDAWSSNLIGADFILPAVSKYSVLYPMLSFLTCLILAAVAVEVSELASTRDFMQSAGISFCHRSRDDTARASFRALAPIL